MLIDSGLSRVQTTQPPPWFAILSTNQRFLGALIVSGSVFLGGGILDWFVRRQYLPRISLMLAGAAVSLAVGLLVFRVLTDIQKRYQDLLDRLEKIADLNHHIRNALQVIAYNNVLERRGPAINQVTAEITRIEAVLREVSRALGTRPASRAGTGNRRQKRGAVG